MSNDIALLNDTFDAGTDLAAMLGFATGGGGEQQSTLAELKQLYKAVKGEMEHKGKKMTVETVAGGNYSLTTADGKTVYSDTVTVRIFMQRYQYQRFEKYAAPIEGKDGKMFRSVMATSLNNGDLKDNYGGFNCGRPGGYIKDYDSLAGPLRDIVKNTKRVLLVFGFVTLDNPVDENGNAVEFAGPTPFFMRIKNSKSYKNVEGVAKALAKLNRLPIQYNVQFSSDNVPLPNGELNHFITASPLSPVDLTTEDQQAVKDFLSWVEYQNAMILKLWSAAHEDDITEEQKELLQSMINITNDAAPSVNDDDEIPF